MGSSEIKYNKTVLDNGVRVLSEYVPGLRTTAIGLWVQNGSRFETDDEAGISHFIEHMFFKGTEKRTSLDISKEIESVGGLLNAFTSREYTCYYCKVIDEHLPRAVDLLSDMFRNSAFDPAEIEKERGVIIQEIKMYEDTPDDYVHDVLYRNIFAGSPIGRPVIGSVDTVSSFSRDTFLDYLKRQYHPGRVIIAAAGSLEHDKLVDMIAAGLDIAGSDCPSPPTIELAEVSPIEVFKKDTEQAHVALAVRGPHYTDEDRYPWFCLNTELGGGMSSRLFQEVREKRGLVYSIHSWVSMYADAGFLGVYGGTAPEKVTEMVELVAAELKKIRSEKLEVQTLKDAREQMKGHLLISSESTDSRMNRLARNEIYTGKYITYEEVVDKIEAVTVDNVIDVAVRRLDLNQLSIAVVGPVEESAIPVDAFK